MSQDDVEEAAGEYDPVDEAAFEAQQRLWIRALAPIVSLAAQHEWADPRVRYAVDMAAVAAAERIVRICGGDLMAQTEDTP